MKCAIIYAPGLSCQFISSINRLFHYILGAVIVVLVLSLKLLRYISTSSFGKQVSNSYAMTHNGSPYPLVDELLFLGLRVIKVSRAREREEPRRLELNIVESSRPNSILKK